MSKEAAYLIALTRLEGIGAVGAVRIAKAFRTTEALVQASPNEVYEAVGQKCGWEIRNQLNQREERWTSLLRQSEELVHSHVNAGIRPIAIIETDYPPLLQHIPDPPPVLFVKGNISLLRVIDAVAVIGTREPTNGGIEVASRVARYLATSGFVVVSGLARGIDSAAHVAACDVGFTVAVLATPLDKIYPAENRGLTNRIVQSGGALVSEVPIGERTYKNSFVRRDRIQSGLSLAAIPVQTDIEGGTMHTVRFAETQKRLLFCPAPLHKESSRKEYAGIWQLIRTGRATSFESKDYPELVTKLRQYKARLVHEHRLIDVPLPPRPLRTPDEVEIQVSDQSVAKPLPAVDPRLAKLEQLCRELGFDVDKKAFNAALAKIRSKFFGKQPRKPRSSKTEGQQKLIV